MLKLTNIVKRYTMGDTTTEALKGINLEFRSNEFVSILGPSGCGKTTLLNIIGGLDRYTEGDLFVNGISTKQYLDGDWDIYRNKAIGFVFQSYNLIMHQTVLANVELALTLSGVSKSERKKRAIEALEKVGLQDQLHKKPSQMSGGQMQRVAIARSLINNPEILLADEPTGALDTETSVQIMEILKEVAKDRLVIMVTHNPDLAKEYSSRIINFLDGQVVHDSNPYQINLISPIAKAEKLKEKKNRKKPLSLLTALSLSLNNLLTKKARTILTGFAGSIGIIGIALILSLSSGMQNYILSVQQDTMSSYPITIQSNNLDMTAVMGIAMGGVEDDEEYGTDKIYSKDVMSEMLSSISEKMASNDLQKFKEFLDSEESNIHQYVNDIQYSYGTPMNIYKSDTSNGLYQINPSDLLDDIMPGSGGGMGPMMGNVEVWQQLMASPDTINKQFSILAGKLPEAWNEVVIIADENNQITDYTLYTLGLKDKNELLEMMQDIKDDKPIEITNTNYEYEDLLNLTFKLVANTDYFEKNGNVWADKSEDPLFVLHAVDNAETVKVVGVVKPSENSTMTNNGGAVGYTAALTEHLINRVNESEIAKEQMTNPDVDIFTGTTFSNSEDAAAFDMTSLSQEQQTYLQGLSDQEQAAAIASMNTASLATFDNNLTKLGVSDIHNPSTIQIYPKDFESKDAITNIIKDYNKQMTEKGETASIIEYTDYTEILMRSVNTVINGISYVLIAFVAISLVVSSIMIGIITYISVLERTKEIGVLRSIGASKGDISRVFNAETLIVGFVAGALGIGITFLLTIPANAIIFSLSGIQNVAQMPVSGAVVLILISMALTFIAGLIPAKIAANKDPVVALRSE